MRHMLSSLVAICLSATTATATDWLQFRGPDGSGVAKATKATAEWSDTKNLLWKTDLPGHGSSSPILVGDQIFVTYYTGAGKDNPSAEGLKRHLVCLARAGKILWTRDIAADAADDAYRGFQALHGYASSTPASDGKHVYCFFGIAGVVAFDLDGKQIWRSSVGKQTHGWGSGSSVVLHDDLVIVNAGVESGEIVALNKADGKKAWSQQSGTDWTWSTPILAKTTNGTELVSSARNAVTGINLKTGKVAWTCNGVQDYVCPSVVVNDGVAFAIGGRSNTAIAFKLGGSGDVTAANQLWSARKGSNVSSPLYHDGHLYWAHESQGTVYCLNAKTGDVVYEKQLSPEPGRIYASATLADRKIYYVTRENGTYVIEASPTFKQLAHNTFAADRSVFNASPAIVEGRIYLRSDRAIYCIGEK
ncbi:MAG: serine/threonine protein kinase [Gemmataceae bacterium]|nr:serine/threonine protein kinase [Gemmataceae bacterium]